MKCPRAFTIIELLLAVVLLGVLVTVVYSTFISSVNAGRRAVSVSTRYARVARVLEIMGRELESAFLAATYRGGSNAEPVTVFIGEDDTVFGRDADHLTFWTLAADYLLTGSGDADISEMAEISYYWEADYENDRLALWKRVDQLPDREHAHGGYRVRILDDIRSINIRYFDGREWLDRWDSRENYKLPQAVEIVLSVWDREGSEENPSFFTLEKVVILRLAERKVGYEAQYRSGGALRR